MRPKRWILLTLFLGGALLSAWLSPALSMGRATETALPGGIYGKTLLRNDESLDVNAGNIPGTHDIEWMLDGRLVGKAPELQLQHLRNGEHILSLAYRDSRDQWFTASTLVRVLSTEAYDIQLMAVQAAIYLPLFLEDDPQIYLPLVQH